MSEQKRRWLRFHLLTLVLVVLAAGAALWFCVGRHFGVGPVQQSEWTEREGLAARISVSHSDIAADSQTVIVLELKNASDKTVRICKTTGPSEDAVIAGAGVTEIPRPFVMTYAGPTPLLISDFTVLKPDECVQHEFIISMKSTGELWIDCGRFMTSPRRYMVSAPDVLIFANLSMGNLDPLDMDGNPDSAVGGAPIWRGSITTPAIPLTIGLAWTNRRILTAVGYILATLVLTASLSEFLIRRREGRKPPAPP